MLLIYCLFGFDYGHHVSWTPIGRQSPENCAFGLHTWLALSVLSRGYHRPILRSGDDNEFFLYIRLRVARYRRRGELPLTAGRKLRLRSRFRVCGTNLRELS